MKVVERGAFSVVYGSPEGPRSIGGGNCTVGMPSMWSLVRDFSELQPSSETQGQIYSRDDTMFVVKVYCKIETNISSRNKIR